MMFDEKNRLSSRELQVYREILKGYPHKLIASKLEISLRTVKFHAANIYKKKKVRHKTELILLNQQSERELFNYEFNNQIEDAVIKKEFCDKENFNPDNFTFITYKT